MASSKREETRGFLEAPAARQTMVQEPEKRGNPLFGTYRNWKRKFDIELKFTKICRPVYLAIL